MNQIHLTGLPPGFTARPTTLDDAEQVSEVLNAAALELYGAPDFSVENLRNDWTLPGVDLDLDTRVVLSPTGEMVGYGDMYAFSDVPVHPWVMGRVHPDFRGLGIGSALLGYEVERARSVLDRVPPDARVSVRTTNPEAFLPGKDLLEGGGFNAYRHSLHMRIDLEAGLDDPGFPAGISVAEYRHPEQAADVYRVVEASFKDHSGHVDEPFESGFERFQSFEIKEDGFDPTMWFLAMDGQNIVGVSLGRKWSYTEPEAGWISTLGVLRSHRRRGIARALLLTSFGDYAARGKRCVDLSVDGSSLTGAVGLYESAGMHVHRRDEVFEQELRPGRELSTT